MRHVNARRANTCAVSCSVALVASCIVGGMFLGCGPRGPAVEMVEGVVLLDGQPVEGATVLFSPGSVDGKGEGGLPAAGRTAPDGSFRLNAAGGATFGAGTKVGEYVVTVIKQDHDPVPPPDPNGPPVPPPNVKVWDVLPAVYKHAISSPLRATVKRGRNTYRFELDSSATAAATK